MSLTDVLIVGGGFAGLACAAALANAGARVKVLEAHGGAAPAFRGELLHPRGVRALGQAGLGHVAAAGLGVDVQGFAVFEGPGHDAVLLPYPERASRGFGFDHVRLVEHLRIEVGRLPRVDLVTRSRAEQALLEGGRVVGVRCSRGVEHHAPLVVAADGRHSKLRKLAGIPARVDLLSHMVILGIDGDLLPWAGFGHVFAGAPGPMLTYPYAAHKLRVCIDVPLGVAGGRLGLAAYVRERYAPFVPEPLRSALIAALDRGDFAGCANHAIYTARCAAPGVALVGDAGGCSHPLAATGMTAALNDVLTLAACLSSAAKAGDALADYQRRRYRFVRAREVFAHAIYRVIRGEGAGDASLRAGTFRYWRGGERARRASMGILSGDDSSPATFLAEYARVAGGSARLAWASARGADRVRQAGLALAASAGAARPLLQVARLARSGGGGD